MRESDYKSFRLTADWKSYIQCQFKAKWAVLSIQRLSVNDVIVMKWRIEIIRQTANLCHQQKSVHRHDSKPILVCASLVRQPVNVIIKLSSDRHSISNQWLASLVLVGRFATVKCHFYSNEIFSIWVGNEHFSPKHYLIYGTVSRNLTTTI